MSSLPKLLVAVGTRPEAIKLAPVVLALREASWCEVRVVATAQHREMLDQIHGFFGIEADVDLDVMRPDQTLAGLTSRLIAGIDTVLERERPDGVVVQGDTTTVFATALASFYRKIPVAHVEAGLRTRDPLSPFPEEMNRQLVGRIANMHFAPTRRAADNLLEEGVPESAIHVTGNTVIDALLWAAERVDAERFAAREGRRRVLVTAHRRENFGAPFERMCGALRRLADREDVELLYPVHPNPNVRAVVERTLAGHPDIELRDPLDYPEFVAAMKAADLILTDSGGVQEEAPSLGKPILVLRDNTERPEGVEAGTAELVGTDPERILSRASALLDDSRRYAAMAERENPYGDGRSTERIVDALARRFAQGAVPEASAAAPAAAETRER